MVFINEAHGKMSTRPEGRILMSTQVANEPSFRESVDLMFNRAVALMDLPPGLEDKIRVCNSTYTCLLYTSDAADE